jgi:pimeloyl-ACP methyl ester carboxylesterase
MSLASRRGGSCAGKVSVQSGSERVLVAGSSVVGRIAWLVALLAGSLVVAAATIAAVPPQGDWFFQSPVSPLGPGGGSPSVPQETVTGPALVSVPAPANFLPWLIGIIVIGGIVGVALFWRRDKVEGGEDA